MMLIDTHAHLDFSDYDEDRKNIIDEAKDSGVNYIINIGTDFASSRKSLELTRNFDNIYTSVGVHPHQAKIVDKKGIQILKDLSKADKVVGIGETGLDFHYDNSPREKQVKVFKQHLNLAREIGLPVIIHSREADNKVINILEDKDINHGVFHCFTGDEKFAKKIIELGLYISLNGILTFNSAKNLQHTVESIPLNKILLETDCPFLTPEPNRGKRNQPSYVKYVAKKIAEIKNISQEKVEKVTTENAKNLFQLNI